jgi:glyoxylase-like metal-dependent hydrolase (beta-lactamase superfamily II)
VQINGRNWEVVIGTGHSPEHACLFCPELGLLISGDQVLPRISSNISVWPVGPAENPLKDWLTSCAGLRTRLPGNVFVCPAHQEPFYGLHKRLTVLIDMHHSRLDWLLGYLDEERTAMDCTDAMFEKKLAKHNLQYAVGETIAHLNYLIDKKQIACHRQHSGIDHYVRL